MNQRYTPAALIMLMMLMLVPEMAQAQERSSETLFIRPKLGFSSYLGDNEKSPINFNGDAFGVDGKFPYSLGLELGYQFNPQYSLGLGVLFGNYPVISQFNPSPNVQDVYTEDHPTKRTSVQLIARYLLTDTHVAPYFQAGLHATFGETAMLPDAQPAKNTCLNNPTTCPTGNETSFGPLFGIGLDVAVTPQLSLDLGFNANWAFSDSKADGNSENGFSGGDFLNSLALGVGYRFKGICVPAEVAGLSGPSQLVEGESGTFTANMNAEATAPVTYRLDFGDGSSGTEMTGSHAYSQPGNYTVRLTATNCAGMTETSMPVTVVAACDPAQIVTMTASNMSPDTQTSINFSANVTGSPSITYRWDFGDGTTSTQANPSHTYSQSGTYTVTLEVTNCGGTTRRTMTINVDLYEPPFCATLSEMNSVFFGRNSSTLSAEARAQLQENLQILRDCPCLNVRVEGWAAPGERSTQQLSEDRARAVEQFYIDNGVAASRIVTLGRGRATGVTSKKEGSSQYRRADSIPLNEACGN